MAIDARNLEALLNRLLQNQSAIITQTINEILPAAQQVQQKKGSVIQGLNNRISNFTYDPANGHVFENWYSRYDDVLAKDGASLSNEDKARFLTQKLDALCFEIYSAHILPRTPAQITFEDTVKYLKTLFGHNLSLSSRRYMFYKSTCENDSNMTFDEYTCRVNRLYQVAEISAMNDERVKCFIWTCGLVKPEYEDIRQVALKYLDEKPDATLATLHTHIKQFVQLKETSSQISHANHIPGTSTNMSVNRISTRSRCSNNSKKMKQEYCFSKTEYRTSNREPTSRTNSRYSGRNNRKYNTSKRTVKTVCFESESSEESNDSVATIEFLKRKNNSTPIDTTSKLPLRIYRTVRIQNKEISLRQDTGSDVTVISKETSHKLGSPPLTSCNHSLRAANMQKLDCLGYFTTDFELCGENHHGKCYVVEHDILLLGNRWMQKVPKLWSSISGDPEGKVEIVEIEDKTALQTARKNLAHNLKTSYPEIFTTDLGKCTKMKAHFRVKPGARKIFIKSRPVSYHVLPKLEHELKRLCNTGVCEKVTYSDFAAPAVIIQKKSGDMRLCADFSTGLNDILEDHHYPLPTPEDIFTHNYHSYTF